MLMERVEVTAMSEGRGLLDGEVTVELGLAGGEGSVVTLDLPPGAPGRPATAGQLRRKLEICAGDRADEIDSLTWESAPAFLQEI
jgi:hypothetical protein